MDNKGTIRDWAEDNSPLIKITMLMFNVMIIVIAIIISINYFRSQMAIRERNEKNNFCASVETTEKVAYSYIKSAQTYCDNWASYISKNNMTIDEALNFARDINTSEHVMSHIIFYDTLEGYSTEGGRGESRSPVSYRDVNLYIKNLIAEIETCPNTGEHPHITRSYINPSDGVLSMGFCHNVSVTDDNGERIHALLIRVVTVEELQRQWVFPTGYENAKISIIDKDGDFVIRGDNEVEGVNFYNIIRTSEHFNAELNAELNELINVGENENGSFIRTTNDGIENFYAYHQVLFNNDWIFIGYLATADLDVTRVDLTIVIIAIFGFLLLAVVDGTLVFIVNKQLKLSVEETRRANEAKTVFLSSMSHDIRTPMNAIIGMTSIASRHIDDQEQIKECLRKITLASNHLLTLINDILDISKVESGKLSLNPVVFSLAESSSNLVNVVQPMVKEKDLAFDVHVSNITHEFIYADELRVNQIFINLLSNAVKYTPVGGKVWLSIEQKPSEKKDHVLLVYTVSDTGIGMSEEFMKHMYTAFTRDEDSRISTIQGTGLGLAITKQMVDLMKGTIEAKSKPGEGTTFKVTLDLPTAEKNDGKLELPPIKLLIADDDEIFLESARDVIKSLGADADIVRSGEEAVKLISERHEKNDDYPCVIIDWKMPGMDGLATTKEIKSKVGDSIPIIIISSYDWTDIEDEARRAGVHGFINKPLFPSTVYSKMNELLNFDKAAAAASEDNGEDLKGINLLIAEDNDVNWEIIEALLSFCGITAERAENGQICVDKISGAPEGKYQAILMDVQMPVMNGKEAAKAIRSSENEYVKNIPIIAMTADAFAEDIRSCLDAGMNGHVAKPLDMKKVFKELRKVVSVPQRDNSSEE